MSKRYITAAGILGILLALTSIYIFLPEGGAKDELLTDAARRHRVEAMYGDYKKSFPQVNDIPAERALELVKEAKVLFVDVREPREQEVSMLPGAITDKQFLDNPEAYQDYLIIGYCTISYRSGKLAQKLEKKGIRMLNLQGGILAWLHAGGEVYKNSSPVKRVHVYGKKWDLAPLAYSSVW